MAAVTLALARSVARSSTGSRPILILRGSVEIPRLDRHGQTTTWLAWPDRWRVDEGIGEGARKQDLRSASSRSASSPALVWGKRKLIALITDGKIVRAILHHLGLPTTASRLAPARSLPEPEFAGERVSTPLPTPTPRPARAFVARGPNPASSGLSRAMAELLTAPSKGLAAYSKLLTSISLWLSRTSCRS